eukprot:514110_1
MNILRSFNLLISVSFTTAIVYYVNPTVISSGDGLSWINAYKTVDEALTSANTESDEMWILGGHTYVPMTTDRINCFIANNGIKIFGGFMGTESDISERLSTTPETILSGDINTINDPTDNCYHVLTYTQQLTLDTITITDGYANLETETSYKDQENVLHRYGGALITFNIRRTTQLTLNNIKFINNQAINGGALWFSSNDNTAVNVVITNCIFQNNIAIDGIWEGGYGGAIYLYFLSNITVFNTQFVNNVAAFRGGAVYQDYGGIFECNQCVFTSNTATQGYGGALFSEDRNSQTEGTFPLIINSNFSDNSAAIYGGAICWFNNVEGRIENSRFIDNSVMINGGAIALIWSTNMTNNIQLVGNMPDNTIFYETDFDYVEIDHDLDMDVNAKMNEIYNLFQIIQSDTDLFGYLNSDSIFRCYVDSQQPNNNKDGTTWGKAKKDIQPCLNLLNTTGGDIWVKSGTYNPTEIPQWKINLNKTAVQHKSFILYDNITLYGGFMGGETEVSARNFAQYKTYLSCELNNDRFCNEIMMAADHCIVDGFIFIKAQNGMATRRRRLQAGSGGGNSISVEDVLTSTSAVVGGGIYTNSTNIIVANTIFYKLFSSGKGGAVYCIGLEVESWYPGCETVIKTPTFVNVAFLGNRATARGGAISADANCHFECFYCCFEQNSCSKKGGAVYLDFDCDPIITNSVWKNNYALESGGALAADGASYVIFDGNTTFINNSANWEGGALYSGSGVGPTFNQGFSFDNNIFNKYTIFENNFLRFSGVGQNDIYLWPYSTINMEIVDTTPLPTQPPTALTPSPIPIIQNVSTPNIIFFVIDDMLYTKDMEFMAPGVDLMNKTIQYLDIPLKNIKSIRNEGITIPRTYVGGPKCSPARFSILTGRCVSRANWAIRRTLQTTNGFFGTNITIQTSKIHLNDSVNNIPYQLKTKSDYRTAQIGKWHLLTANDNGNPDAKCALLNNQPDEDRYINCTNIVKTLGFDFVDAFYEGNIGDNAPYGHNPEWMISQSQKFIKQSITDNKPFFLYMAHTLTHTPDVFDSIFNTDPNLTPKGILTGDDQQCLSKTNMSDRCDIWAAAEALGFTKDNDKDYAAAYLWIDNSLGALIKYLKDFGIYDNTFIVITNDHGMGAKGTIYEQGARTFQFIRYPKLFEANSTLSNNFIVSTTDLASIVFNISQTTPDTGYELDSTNWVSDAQNYIMSGDDEYQPECCKCRFTEVFNSRAVVTPQWKYIFRQTSQVESDGNVATFYPSVLDEEQLYDLNNDPSEQNNQINNPSLTHIICELQQKMIAFIDDKCPADDGVCKKPTL